MYSRGCWIEQGEMMDLCGLRSNLNNSSIMIIQDRNKKSQTSKVSFNSKDAGHSKLSPSSMESNNNLSKET